MSTSVRPRSIARTLAGSVLALGAAGAGTLAYALWEARSYRLRRITVPVLPTGATPVRVLHISDLHLTPEQHHRQEWVAQLAALEPDLVIDTGDNLAHVDAVPYVTRSLGRLLDKPGAFVWGSNDYYGPTRKNPLRYLTQPKRQGSPSTNTLPWRDLRAAFEDRGWQDLTHREVRMEIAGLTIALRGTDDAHLNADDYAQVAGPVDPAADVTIGVTHAPYRRVLDAMTVDGLDLILAGHTHGGQVCVPFYGALVTNCDLDTERVSGLSSNQVGSQETALHVSAGLGTSPYAPIRFACPPEATLLTLVPRKVFHPR